MKISLRLSAFAVVALFCSPLFAQTIDQIPNFQTVENGLVRGGRPTEKDLQWLRSQGFQTIVNLEDDTSAVKQEKKWADKLGFDYVSVPMDVFKKPNDAETSKLLDVLNDAGHAGPIFVHCKQGRDRTGLIVGLHRVLNRGWDAKASYDEMLKYGFRSYLSRLDDYYRAKSGLGDD